MKHAISSSWEWSLGVECVNYLTGGGGRGQVFQNKTHRLETSKDNRCAPAHRLLNIPNEVLTCLGGRVKAGQASSCRLNTNTCQHTHSVSSATWWRSTTTPKDTWQATVRESWLFIHNYGIEYMYKSKGKIMTLSVQIPVLCGVRSRLCATMEVLWLSYLHVCNSASHKALPRCHGDSRVYWVKVKAPLKEATLLL